MKRQPLFFCIVFGLFGCGREGQLEDRTSASAKAQALGSLRVVPSALRLQPNAKQTFTVDSNTEYHTWTVVDSTGTPDYSGGGGTVDYMGTYTAPPYPGTFYLRVGLANTPNVSSTVPIVVAASAPPSISVNPAILQMRRGNYQQLSASIWGAASENAVYDAAFKAPACSNVSKGCIAGSSLLSGRANLGPEPNQPNTINGSCADGASGDYHSRESVDAVTVSTTDGDAFAPGKTVSVEVAVWASSRADRLELYYAADASAPDWTLITTLTPDAPGAQTLSATYTLPSGGPKQAVRANFRYEGGSADPCTAGPYDDRDDVVFAVPSVTWRMAGDNPVGVLAFASGNATYYLAPYAQTLDYAEAQFAGSSAYVTIQVLWW